MKLVDGFLRGIGGGGGERNVKWGGASDSDELRSDEDRDGEYEDAPESEAPDDDAPEEEAEIVVAEPARDTARCMESGEGDGHGDVVRECGCDTDWE